MAKNLSKEETRAWVVFIAIVFVGIWIIILRIQIGLIHLAQNMFWISSVVMLLAFLFLFIFLLWGIFKRSDNQGDYWGYYNQEFFDKPMIFLFAAGFFVLSLISFAGILYFYESGYSDQALQNLAQYENQLQSLQQIQSILTGQIVWDIQNQVVEETITNLCKDPNYPCNQIKQSYQIYKNIKGAKDDADSIMGFLKLINKKDEKTSPL